MAKKTSDTKGVSKESPDLPGYPHYPEKEDIYSKEKKDPEIDPGEDVPVKKKRKKAVEEDDLDIPGAELDDADEEVGEEDEENNYYSLGGDNHDDLEEDRGD
ncbi:MAG TPA: hypothetical protein VGM41_01430 [Chitinophagaceae bacterium]|jgi:hypothetical protein